MITCLTLLSLCLLISANADPTLSLNLLKDPGAVCNDGTPGGYYFRKSFNDSNHWVIHLQGGGFCFDLESCRSRNQSSPSLMSTRLWDTKMYGSGVLSVKEEENVHWYFANHVFIGYCSSDSFSGGNDEGFDGWVFMGKRIVSAVFEELRGMGLDEADVVIFSGSSAGAEGLFPNVDDMKKYVPEKAKYRALADSGWFLDFEPFKHQPCHGLGDCTEQGALMKGVQIWNPIVNEDCARANPGNSVWRCMLGYHAYPFIKTPMFVIQFLFDLAQMGHDAIFHIPATEQELQYAQLAAKNLTRTYDLVNVNSVFSASCYHHTIIRNPKWSALTIDGRSLPEVFNTWVNNLEFVRLIDTCRTPNCNPTCP